MSYKMTDEHKKKISDSLKKHRKDNPLRGKNNPNWRGGTRRLSSGYTWVYHPEHPFSSKGKKFIGYVLEHRLKMEQLLTHFEPNSNFLIEVDGNKYLKPVVIVHHKNRNRSDNRLENLEIIDSQSEHLAGHNHRHEAGKAARAKNQTE